MQKLEASNLTRKADGWHSFDCVHKMAGLHFRGHARTGDGVPHLHPGDREAGRGHGAARRRDAPARLSFERALRTEID